MISKQNFVGFGVDATRASEGDVIQAVYALTKVLSTTTNLTKNIEFN